MADEISAVRISELVVLDRPYQTLEMEMNGVKIRWYIKYNVKFDYWTFDLYKGAKPLLHGRRIVLDIDLLAPYNFGLGQIICIHSPTKLVTKEPNRQNLPARETKLLLLWTENVTVD